MCQQCQDKIAALEQLAADRLEYIKALGEDLAEAEEQNKVLKKILWEAI